MTRTFTSPVEAKAYFQSQRSAILRFVERRHWIVFAPATDAINHPTRRVGR